MKVIKVRELQPQDLLLVRALAESNCSREDILSAFDCWEDAVINCGVEIKNTDYFYNLFLTAIEDQIAFA